MMKLGWTLTALVVFSAALTGCGSSGSSVDVGSDCTTADAGVAATDCGSLQCLCPSGPAPGVCSKQCSKAADCSSFGSDTSCAKDFCPGVNLCLQGWSGEKLP